MTEEIRAERSASPGELGAARARPKRDGFFRRSAPLLLILAVALLLRAADLGKNPPGLFCDEAAIGWDAACIAKTGRNQHGEPFPLFFPSMPRYQLATESFGDYTEHRGPLFIYSTAAVMGAVGRTPLAARWTAALFGTLAVLATYLLAKRFLGKAGGLVAAGLLAVSPWAIHTSRLGIEWPTMVPLTTLGTYAFVRGFADRRWWIASGVLFGLAPYGYSVARLFAPLLMLCLAIAYAGHLRRSLRWAVVWAATAALLVAPMAANLSRIATRFDTISVFNRSAREALARNPSATGEDNDRYVLGSEANAGQGPVRVGSPFETALALWARSWSPRFLLHGDGNPRHAVPGFGLLHAFEILLIPIGAFVVIRKARDAEWARFLLAWAVVWPIPSSLTASPPHAVRTLAALPLPQILAAAGAVACWERIRRAGPRIRSDRAAVLCGLVLGAAAVIAIVQVPRHLRALFVDFPKRHGDAYQIENTRAVRYAIAALDSGACTGALASPIHVAMDNTICLMTGFDPSAFLEGKRPRFWIGLPQDYSHDVLLYLTAYDFLQLPADPAWMHDLPATVDPYRHTQWFLEHALANATPKIEKLYKNRAGDAVGFLIRADDVMDAWYETHREFVRVARQGQLR